MTHFKRWFAAASLTALVLPWSAIAATPEQSLDKAVKSMDSITSYRLDMDMKMDIGERVIGKSGSGITGQIAVKLGTRVLDKQNGEGRLSLERLSIKGVESGQEISFAIDQPMAIEWQMTGSMLYFRLAQVPAMVVEYLKTNMEVDLAPIIGVWIGMDAPNGVNDLKNIPIFPTQVISRDLPQNITAQSAIRKLPMFRVIGVEKRMKNDAGDDLTRLRVRINPALINAVRLAEIKALPRDKYYREDLAALNKRYVELRSNLNRLFMAMNLNVTKNRLERMEIGGTIEEPTEKCTYSTSLKRNICKVASVRMYKISIGVNMAPAGSEPVLPPSIWKTIEEIQKILMPPPTPQPVVDPMVETLTAPTT
ncbi:hypothetical protein K8R04_01815 [Candidatus Uhrbacteria bacterium]|nr:hypothetical protein [Candidatus Uhrbacteria bacterium]